MKILGLMSGTSCDGLDCCDVDIDIDINYNFKYRINQFTTIPYDSSEKDFIQSLRVKDNYKIKSNEIKLTNIYVEKINQFIKNNNFDYIACHGQTVCHIDRVKSIQLLDPKILFDEYKVPIIYNFRQEDIRNGGNGAPLMPFLDWLLFKESSKNIITLNIGGISNISYLPKDGNREKVLGFDVGPGMNLIDNASKTFYRKDSDYNAEFSKKGKVNHPMIQNLMNDSYLKESPPKSTDINYFGINFLEQSIKNYPQVSGYDFIRTLVQYTVECIKYSIEKYVKLNNEDFVLIGSGGGVEHPIIVEELVKSGYKFKMISDYTIDSSTKEALLIAVMGVCKVLNLANNMPSATGTGNYIELGDIYNE